MSARLRATPFRLSAAILAAMMLAAPVARGDSIQLSDRTIEGCRVQTIRGGAVFHLDASSRLEQVPASDIVALRFDGLRELDDAERVFARGDGDGAIDLLLKAFINAKTEPQRAWVHARLARVRASLGDTIEAAGHFAAVLTIDPAPAWIDLQPAGEPNEPTFLSTSESLAALERARTRVTDPALREAVEALIASIRPLHERMRSENPDLRYRTGSTISGILTRDVGAPRPKRERPPAAADPDPSLPPGAGFSAPPAAPAEPDNPQAIDALLAESKFGEALSACERAARGADARDLAQFLYQYGRALTGAGQSLDAAVRFMQCASHFGDTEYGVRSLMSTAVIYRDHLVKPDVAARLLHEAASRAEALGDAELAAEARNLLRK